MERIQRVLGNFVILFFVVIISLNVLATIQLFDKIIETQNNVKSIENKIEVFKLGTIREANISEQKIIDFYKEISDKTDDAISRVITIVGLVAGIVSFFSLLLAFKAPHDIDRRMDKLNQMIKETGISVDETKYQVAISSALAQKDKYESIKKLTSVIQKYPEKPDAYLMRGFLYDDIKKYDSAINDYNIARKQGCEPAVYYNSIAIAYSNKGEEKKAIECYTKAINLVKDNASYYCNRACSYDELNQYEAALEDFAKTIEIDEDFYEAYYNRNFTYEKLWRQESDRSKQQYYIKCRKADLDRAIELNPEDGGAQKLLKKFIEELTEKGFLPSRQEVIAQIDENIGDISVSQGDYLEAFEHYADAFNYHAIAYYIHNKDDHEESVDRISMKIVEIILNKKESALLRLRAKSRGFFPISLLQLAVSFTKRVRREAQKWYLPQSCLTVWQR